MRRERRGEAARTASRRARRRSLKGLTERLIGFGTYAENIFDLRREELRQIAVAQASLDDSNWLVLRLGKEVAELVQTAQDSSDAAALRAHGRSK